MSHPTTDREASINQSSLNDGEDIKLSKPSKTNNNKVVGIPLKSKPSKFWFGQVFILIHDY